MLSIYGLHFRSVTTCHHSRTDTMLLEFTKQILQTVDIFERHIALEGIQSVRNFITVFCQFSIKVLIIDLYQGLSLDFIFQTGKFRST